MLNSGVRGAATQKGDAGAAVGVHARRVPPRLPNIRAPGVGAEIPNATFTGQNGVRGGPLAAIAQTKYGAPIGWKTPAGQKGEGFLWTTPGGRTVYGAAPAVFQQK